MNQDQSTIASAAFILFITAIFSYVLSLFLPKKHYPRFFALVIGLATVPLLAMLKVPGASEALVALFFSAGFTLWPIWLFAFGEVRDWLFRSEDTKTAVSTSLAPAPRPRGAVSAFWPLISGLLLGIIVAGSIVSAVIIPPGYLWSWIMSKETLADRIERALKPGEAWQTLRTHDRETSEALARSLADLANATERLSVLDAQLKTAQDELGKLPPNSSRNVRIKVGSGLRVAGGTIYIGVSRVPYGVACSVNGNSDKVDKIGEEFMHPGGAISVASSRGKYRVVLIGFESEDCTFDIVKD